MNELKLKRKVHKLMIGLLIKNNKDFNAINELCNMLRDTELFIDFIDIDTLINMLENPERFKVKIERYSYSIKSDLFEDDKCIDFKDVNRLQGYFFRKYKIMNK